MNDLLTITIRETVIKEREKWWLLTIARGGRSVLSETCWDYAEAERKAREFVAGCYHPAKGRRPAIVKAEGSAR